MKRVPLPLVFGPVLAAILVMVGTMLGSVEIAYIGPAIIHGVLAWQTGWRFLAKNEGLGDVLFYGGAFLFYHFQILLPAYWAEFAPAISEYSQEARLMSALGTSLMPLAGLAIARLLEKIWPVGGSAIAVQREGPVRFDERRMFIGFVALFGLVAVPNVIFGGVVVSSVNAILYMRGVQEATGGVLVSEQMASLLNINHFACSLVTLTWALYRSKYRRIVLLLLPFSVIWALGSIFAMGTRTQVLQFGLAFIVPLIGTGSFKKSRIVVIGALGFFIFVTAQVMTFYRTVGLKEVQLAELVANIGGIQGLETMHDQTRAFEMYVEGYENPQVTGVGPVDVALGLIYRPIELAMFPLPRSLFPWKPVDPTVYDLSHWAIRRLGVNSDRHTWGITGGLLGRDTLRWGGLGAFVAIFWFTMICWFSDREYRRDRRAVTQRIIAGAFAGTAISMFRDLSPLWCLQLIPAALILIHSRAVTQRNRALRPGMDAREQVSSGTGEDLAGGFRPGRRGV